MACGILGERSEAEEATQVAFVEIFRDLHAFRGGSAFSTWAYRICVNVCLTRRDKLRRRRSVVQSVEEEQLARLPDPGDSPERRFDRQELGRQ